MSTFLIEPGAKLANRYRLDDVVSETGGATRWKATDETLARPVAVWTFTEGFPRTSEAVRAARATSRIPDSRVTQVFDADDTAPVPYVVEEWVIGSSLTDLLAQGPMEPERAAGLVTEAAEAIAAAHEGGLHHLCLTPDKLMWSSGGAVKVTGIGVDAALLGTSVHSPGAVDAQGLGHLLYAALTGHWPGPQQSKLPPAPQGPGGPLPADQVRPGITEPLAGISTRAALPHLVGQVAPGPALDTPAAFCQAMADVPRLIPLPVSPTEPTPEPEQGTSRRTGEFGSTGPRRSERAAAAPEPSPRAQRRSERRNPLRKALVWLAAGLLFVGVVAGAWTLGSMMRPTEGGEDDPGNGSEDTGDADDSVDLADLEIVGADGFDPLGDQQEHGNNAPNAYDGDPATVWKTEGYDDPLGPLNKDGVGLLFDLGQSQEVHELDLTVPQNTYGVQIRVGDSHAGRDMATLDGELPVAWEGPVTGTEAIELDEPAAGQYVVVWFTELPSEGGTYRGAVHEVEIRGN